MVPTCVRASLGGGGQHQEHCARSHGTAQCWCWLSLIRTLAAGTHTQPQSGHIKIIKRIHLSLDGTGTRIPFYIVSDGCLMFCCPVCMCTLHIFCSSVPVSSSPHAILFPPPPPTHQKVERQTFLFPQPRVESGPGLRTNPSIANVIKSIVIHTHAFSLLQPTTMDTCRKVCAKWSHIFLFRPLLGTRLMWEF